MTDCLSNKLYLTVTEALRDRKVREAREEAGTPLVSTTKHEARSNV
jgi:hypothetical protein